MTSSLGNPTRPKLLFDARWISAHGIGRVSNEILERLRKDFDIQEIRWKLKPSQPFDFIVVGLLFWWHKPAMFVTMGYNGSPLIGPRQVFVIHDLILIDKREPHYRLKRFYFGLVLRRAARQAHAVLTVSEATREKLVQLWPELRGKIRVNTNGASEAFMLPQDQNVSRNGIVIFSNTRWHKNLTGMLDGLAIFFDQAVGPALDQQRVYMVGQRSAEVVMWIKKRGLSERIEWVGRIDDAQLANLFQRSRALMFCSFEEGFGLPIIEALACGCRVVASNIAVLREVGGPSCVYVDPENPHTIAAGLRSVLAGDRRANAYVGPISGKIFSWSESYQQLRALIYEVVSARRG